MTMTARSGFPRADSRQHGCTSCGLAKGDDITNVNVEIVRLGQESGQGADRPVESVFATLERLAAGSLSIRAAIWQDGHEAMRAQIFDPGFRDGVTGGRCEATCAKDEG